MLLSSSLRPDIELRTHGSFVTCSQLYKPLESTAGGGPLLWQCVSRDLCQPAVGERGWVLIILRTSRLGSLCLGLVCRERETVVSDRTLGCSEGRVTSAGLVKSLPIGEFSLSVMGGLCMVLPLALPAPIRSKRALGKNWMLRCRSPW